MEGLSVRQPARRSLSPSHTQFKDTSVNIGKAHFFAKAGKSFCDIREMLSNDYGDKALKKAQTCRILKVVKEGKEAVNQKFVITPQLVASVSASLQRLVF